MLVSWDWLNDYVDLSSVSPDELAERFALSGLNHEGTEVVGGTAVIDLEVTSNRGDCLGHIGIAREAAVLYGKALCIPSPNPAEGSTPVAKSIELENRFPAGCTRYTARIIRGVRIGPSPQWLVSRLAAIGVKSVNNVVDVTNYVMMECGQPLHAFDLSKIAGNRIIVRPATPGEKFLAIDHHTYELDDQTVVIADSQRGVALGGVMGGADSEISDATTDVLVEAALFDPLSIRRTARRLKLQSPSSFRFERRPDPAGVDWASRRACELILKVAGGVLDSGVASVGTAPTEREPIVFRPAQIARTLGTEIPIDRATEILESLGCRVKPQSQTLVVTPPSWRSDLTREIDLIEEVARIHGYDRIPENVSVPMAVAQPRRKDVAIDRVRQTLSAFGIDEAMTPSVVGEKLESFGSLWTSQLPLATETPLLEGAKLLRRSLIPSLLAARLANQTQSIRDAQLYEIANIVLPSTEGKQLPRELTALGIVTSGDLRVVKGIVQAVVCQLGGEGAVNWQTAEHVYFSPGSAQSLTTKDSTGTLQTIGWLGLVHPQVQDRMDLDAACCVAEIDVGALTDLLIEVRRAKPFSLFPTVQRDLNFIVDQALRWGELERVCRMHGGAELQSVEYRETYRDAKKDGADKKRVLLSLQFQSSARTLTGDEVDRSVQSVVDACNRELAAKLLG